VLRAGRVLLFLCFCDGTRGRDRITDLEYYSTATTVLEYMYVYCPATTARGAILEPLQSVDARALTTVEDVEKHVMYCSIVS
jgi:hypothetical protein